MEAHYKACLYAGIKIAGSNAEVMPSQVSSLVTFSNLLCFATFFASSNSPAHFDTFFEPVVLESDVFGLQKNFLSHIST